MQLYSFANADFISVFKDGIMHIKDDEGNVAAIDGHSYITLVENIYGIEGMPLDSYNKFINEPFKMSNRSVIVGNRIMPFNFRRSYDFYHEKDDFVSNVYAAFKNIDLETFNFKNIDFEIKELVLAIIETPELLEIDYKFQYFKSTETKYDEVSNEDLLSVELPKILNGEYEEIIQQDNVSKCFKLFTLSVKFKNYEFNNHIISIINNSNSKGVIRKRYIPSTILEFIADNTSLKGGIIIDERYDHTCGILNLTFEDLSSQNISLKLIRSDSNHYSGSNSNYCFAIDKNSTLADIPQLWYNSIANNDLSFDKSKRMRAVDFFLGALGICSGELYAQMMKDIPAAQIKFMR